MKSHAVIFAAGLALALPAWCGQQVQKCIDDAGHVTLTDQPCDGLAPEIVQHVAEVAPRPVPGRRLGVPLPPRQIVIDEKKNQPSMFLPGDVHTLKAARNALRMLDGSASPLRAQRVAGY
jgi:hypothetical protein